MKSLIRESRICGCKDAIATIKKRRTLQRVIITTTAQLISKKSPLESKRWRPGRNTFTSASTITPKTWRPKPPSSSVACWVSACARVRLPFRSASIRRAPAYNEPGNHEHSIDPCRRRIGQKNRGTAWDRFVVIVTVPFGFASIWSMANRS